MWQALDSFRRVQFDLADSLRRAQGDAIGALGLATRECPYEVVSASPFWRLRDYGGRDRATSLLVIAAPIKRPYIWDLAPSASAIRCCLRHGLHVYLLEWEPATHRDGNRGLEDYVRAIDDCVTAIAGSAASAPPVIGHSLGGTLAAIYAAFSPDSIRGLALLSAPLCFHPGRSTFRDALVSLVPEDLTETHPFPGSLLSWMSMLASPNTFIWSRMIDAALSTADRHALEIHARVERWALDEVPLPGRLVHQIIDWLYRENRLCSGALTMDGVSVGPERIAAPTLAIVNTADEIAPVAAVEPFLAAMGAKDIQMIKISGERGVCLQHVGVLVGREAHAGLWPSIFSWIDAHC
jgi:polyhydroxyalkanoate synthase